MRKKLIRTLSLLLTSSLIFTSINITALAENNMTNSADDVIVETDDVTNQNEKSLSNPVIDEDGIVTWDCVYFGNYWQNDTNLDGVANEQDEKEPIKWRVLNVDGDDVFLLSDKAVDFRNFHTEHVNITWEECELRSWLNSEFKENAFDETEIIAIKTTAVTNEKSPQMTGRYEVEDGNITQDDLFLLNYLEATNVDYGFTTEYLNNYMNSSVNRRQCDSTQYAYDKGSTKNFFQNGINKDYSGACYWWLRTMGGYYCDEEYVDTNGGISLSGTQVNWGQYSVRPALHIKLSSTAWKNAGQVHSSDETHYVSATLNANGGNFENYVENRQQKRVLYDKKTARFWFNKDKAIGELIEPTYEGHTFSGWYDSVEGGNKITKNDSFSSDVQLYAHWDEPTEPEFGFYFKSDEPIELLYKYNENYIVSYLDVVGDDANFCGNALGYNHQMARYAATISTMAYMSDTIDGKDLIAKNFKTLGFDNVSRTSSIIKNNEYYNFYPDPTCNIQCNGLGLYSPCWIVHKKINIDGKLTTIVVVAIRGTYHEEWIDNFETENQDTHKGFENASNYIYDELIEYIKRNNLENDDVHLLITGHSRGGAVSNLLGAKINDNIDNKPYFDKKNTYVYTFATPNVSTNGHYLNYENIFNIVNPEDFVTKVMASKWGYSRYGKTYVLPSSTTDLDYLSSGYLNELKNKFNKYSGYTETYEPYKLGMTEVSDYVSTLCVYAPSAFDYAMKKQNTKYAYSTVKNMFKYSLGYYKSGSPNKQQFVYTGLRALIKNYGAPGWSTLGFFFANQLVTHDFEKAHLAETYLAAMYSVRNDKLIRQKLTLNGIVNCPVDITVKNSLGEVVGSIVNNVVDESIENPITMSVDGDSKSFYIPYGDEFSVELTGNDDGVMDYSLCLVDADTGEISRDYYHEIPVVKGESYTQTFNLETDLKTDLTDKNLNTVSVNAIIDEESLGTLTYNVTVEGEGQANSIYNVTPGDYVTLSAYADENNEFYGWYDKDDNLVSSELEYSFSAFKSADYTAKFSNVVVGTTGLQPDKSSVYMTVDEYTVNNITVSPANATYKFPTFTSSDESIAEVDMFGGITARAEGVATITVTSDDGITSSYKVYVTKPEYQLTLDANGGLFANDLNDVVVSADKTKATKTVLLNNVYGELPSPTREGYTFIGWSLDKEGTLKVTSETLVETDSDITLYANWKENEKTPEKQEYTITFDANGGSVKVASKVVENGAAYGELPQAERPGFEFIGWYTDKENGTEIKAESVVSLTANQTLYAHWKENKSENTTFTVHFDANGGVVGKTSKTLATGDKYGELPVPIRNGYIFDGWYSDKENGTKIQADTVFTSNADQTLYAHWSNIQIVVKQKFDVSKYFQGVTGIKKYKVEKTGGAKAQISKKGVVTASKAGTIKITPLVKKGKKYVTIDGVEPLTLVVKKPVAKKTVKATVGQVVNVNDLITSLPENSNEVTLSISKKSKVAQYDASTNSVKLIAKGKVKVTITIKNDQNKMVKYYSTVKIQ